MRPTGSDTTEQRRIVASVTAATTLNPGCLMRLIPGKRSNKLGRRLAPLSFAA
jgi:hypothetical protein